MVEAIIPSSLKGVSPMEPPQAATGCCMGGQQQKKFFRARLQLKLLVCSKKSRNWMSFVVYLTKGWLLGHWWENVNA